MKTDRELLELAARADGYREAGINKAYTDGLLGNWNPLESDGDALRLAVKLRLVIDTDYNDGAAVGSAFLDMDCCYEPDNPMRFGADRNSATRRAIVRAAAAIGEGMK
jgi:hypothetical protein